MDIVWIVLAFAFGLAVRQVGLPPLVGYLLAGFLLASQGAVGGETVQRFADMGVTLLLFIIGLKLDIRGLKQPSIWGTASVHMLVTVLLFAAGLYALGGTGLAIVSGLDFQTALLVGFALSFSSTVFAVKVLESKGEMSALYGRIAIGILIMQDIAAVVFIAFSTGKVPVHEELIYCGNVMSDLELANLEWDKIEARLANRLGDNRSNVKIEPGKSIPFMVVFSGLPDDLEEFTIEVTGSTSLK